MKYEGLYGCSGTRPGCYMANIIHMFRLDDYRGKQLGHFFFAPKHANGCSLYSHKGDNPSKLFYCRQNKIQSEYSSYIELCRICIRSVFFFVVVVVVVVVFIYSFIFIYLFIFFFFWFRDVIYNLILTA